MSIEDQPGKKPIPDKGTTAVFCDSWKRKIFLRHLKKAGLEMKEVPKKNNPVPKTAFWKVTYNSREHLNEIAEVVKAANTEAHLKKQHNS